MNTVCTAEMVIIIIIDLFCPTAAWKTVKNKIIHNIQEQYTVLYNVLAIGIEKSH